ncbi:MAG: ATP-binding protein [Chloroflexota bacterium]|jgi:signal transduction histidine kinase
MGKPLHLLIIEDSEDDADLVLLQLRRGGYAPTFSRVDNPEDMARALEQQRWDIVISDYVMPHFSGLAALALLRAKQIDIPFIVVSGKIGEDVAVEAMKAGAHDYIMKGNLARLVPAIERELREAAVRRERRQMEEQLHRAQRLEMAGIIAGQVAHDFANFLTPLMGYPQLIKRMLPQGHSAAKFCDILLQNLRQLSAINDDLLTLGRRGRAHREPININELVDRALAQIVERPPGLAIEVNLSADLPLIEGSQAQLLRVLANLITNARDVMKDSGVLGIRTEAVKLVEPLGRYNRIPPGDYIILSISDTGSGIPQEIADRIFDPFFTTKRSDEHRGSGLGLSIVQAIVADHQGYIDLETTIGRGTTFIVYLPVNRTTASRVAAGSSPPSPPA